MDLSALGTRIRLRREKRGLRQLDIANSLRVSAQAVSKWERGENAPDIAILPELARLLDVSLEYLLSGDRQTEETFDAVVFCTGLNGFAKRSATMTPRDVAAWANTIYYAITEAVLRCGGVPVKCVGDGFLGFFAGQDAALRALDAGRASRLALGSAELVVMLHGGPIYLGTLGHPDYAHPDIIGETVNTAFMLLGKIASRGGVTALTGPVRARLPESARKSFGKPESLRIAPGVEWDVSFEKR